MSRIARLPVMCFILSAVMILPAGAVARDHAPIRVVGCHFMLGKVDSWAKSFLASNPDHNIVVSGCNEVKGFKDLSDNKVELVVASRAATQEERADAGKKGIRLMERRIAYDALCLLVNKDLPIEELSVEQVRGIFTGRLTRWSQVGGPDLPIKSFAFDPSLHGSMKTFIEDVLNGRDMGPETDLVMGPRDLFVRVATTKGAIGVVGYYLFTRMPVVAKGFSARVIALKKTAGPAVLPSRKTIEDQSYPLLVPIYLYWNGERANPALSRFVAYCSKRAAEQ